METMALSPKSYPTASYQGMSSGFPTSAERYPGSTSTSSKPLESYNYPPAYDYQPASKTKTPGSVYSPNNYYSNTPKPWYQPNTGYAQTTLGRTGQPGYQRTQTPTTPPYRPGLSRTTVRPQMGYERPQTAKTPIFGPYAPGALNTGIPTPAGYQRTYTPASYVTSPYLPGTGTTNMPKPSGYVRTQTPQGAVVNQYSSGLSDTRKQQQLGPIRTPTPQPLTVAPYAPVQYGGSFVINQYKPQQTSNVPSYNGYPSAQNQQPYGQYPTYQSSGINPEGQRRIIGTGSTSQETGRVRSGLYSLQANRGANAKSQYQIAQTNRLYPVPQTNTIAQYSTPQTVRGVWGEQYQSISSPDREGGGQYGPLQMMRSVSNGGYPSDGRSYVQSNRYQSEDSWRENISPMTSTNYADVRTTSYTNGWVADDRTEPSQTQNAYVRADVYSNRVNDYLSGTINGRNAASYTNQNSFESTTSPAASTDSREGIYDSPYAANTPLYTPTNPYLTSTSINVNAVRRQRIPRPKSQSQNQKPKTLQVTNQTSTNTQNMLPKVKTTQGQLKGPTYNKNQYKPIYYKQLDNNGQYPSNVQQYGHKNSKSNVYESQGTSTRVPDRPLAGTFGASAANAGSPGSIWTSYAQAGNSQARSQALYTSWSTRAQKSTARRLWNPGVVPNVKVDDTVMYSKAENTHAPQTTTRTVTNAGRRKIPLTKDIDMDNVVQRAFADFLTNVSRKKKKRKKRRDANSENRTKKLWR